MIPLAITRPVKARTVRLIFRAPLLAVPDLTAAGLYTVSVSYRTIEVVVVGM